MARIVLFCNLLFSGCSPLSDGQILKDGNNISLHDVPGSPKAFSKYLLDESSSRACESRGPGEHYVYGATTKVHLAKEVHPSELWYTLIQSKLRT